jgi:hypothetical protein
MMPVSTVATITGELLEVVHAVEIGLHPLPPEIDDHGKHGAGVQHDQQQGHLRGRGIETHQLFGHHDVGGTGYGQQFSQPLNNGKENHFE